MNYYTIRTNINLEGQKTLSFPGIDFGRCIHKILKETDKYYFIQRNGRMCYLYRSQSVYSSPSFNILEKQEPCLEDKKYGNAAVKSDKGIEFEYTRQNKKEKYQEAINKWKELTNEN